MTAMNTCVQVQANPLLLRKDCVGQIFNQLYWLAHLMDDLANEDDCTPLYT